MENIAWVLLRATTCNVSRVLVIVCSSATT